MAQPAERQREHRLRAGTYAAASVTTSHAVSAFTEQADQDAEVQQWALDTTRCTPPRRRVVRFADNSAGEDGEVEFAWVFGYLTNAMLKYLLDTFLPGGVQAAAVTAMTYDATDTAIFVQGTLLRPQLPGDGEAIFGGWRDVTLRFIGGTVVT